MRKASRNSRNPSPKYKDASYVTDNDEQELDEEQKVPKINKSQSQIGKPRRKKQTKRVKDNESCEEVDRLPREKSKKSSMGGAKQQNLQLNQIEKSLQTKNSTASFHARNNQEKHMTEKHEETETVEYNEQNGMPRSKVTQITRTVTTNEKQDTVYEWKQEIVKRKEHFKHLRIMTQKEAAGSSDSFKFYVQRLQPLIDLFLKKSKDIYTTRDETHALNVWNDPSFIMRFMFGLPCGVDRVTGSNGGSACDFPTAEEICNPPWLACCWTMPELLAACTNQTVQLNFWRAKVNIGIQQPVNQESFVIESRIMDAYITGHMLFNQIPSLKNIMRKRVQEEFTKSYFPLFKAFQLEEHISVIEFEYDFELVVSYIQERKLSELCNDSLDNYSKELLVNESTIKGSYHIPEHHFPSANPRDSCFLIGICEIDGPLIRLLQDNNIQTLCLNSAEKLSLTEQKPRQRAVEFAFAKLSHEYDDE